MNRFFEKCSVSMECVAIPPTSITSNVKNYALQFNSSSSCIGQRSLSRRNNFEITRIKTFTELESGWDSYNSDKITKQVINRTIKYIEEINDYNQDIYFSSPGPNGEISIELKHGEKNAEILIYPDNKTKYVFFEGNNFKMQGDAPIKKIGQIIQSLFK